MNVSEEVERAIRARLDRLTHAVHSVDRRSENAWRLGDAGKQRADQERKHREWSALCRDEQWESIRQATEAGVLASRGHLRHRSSAIAGQDLTATPGSAGLPQETEVRVAIAVGVEAALHHARMVAAGKERQIIGRGPGRHAAAAERAREAAERHEQEAADVGGVLWRGRRREELLARAQAERRQAEVAAEEQARVEAAEGRLRELRDYDKQRMIEHGQELARLMANEKQAVETENAPDLIRGVTPKTRIFDRLMPVLGERRSRALAYRVAGLMLSGSTDKGVVEAAPDALAALDQESAREVVALEEARAEAVQALVDGDGGSRKHREDARLAKNRGDQDQSVASSKSAGVAAVIAEDAEETLERIDNRLKRLCDAGVDPDTWMAAHGESAARAIAGAELAAGRGDAAQAVDVVGSAQVPAAAADRDYGMG